MLITRENRVKIGDFGISKQLENTVQLANTSLGTPFYLSPEICLGQKYDYKSDAWMLGCVLYEMCTLVRPFEGESLSQVVHQIIEVPFAPLEETRFDPIFNQILTKLLTKNAFLRASISEILEEPALASRVDKFNRINEELLRLREEEQCLARRHSGADEDQLGSTKSQSLAEEAKGEEEEEQVPYD